MHTILPTSAVAMFLESGLPTLTGSLIFLIWAIWYVPKAPAKSPFPAGSSVTAKYLSFLQFSGLFQSIGHYALWAGVTLRQQDTLSGYTTMNDLAARAFQSTKDIWCPDRAFGECRLGGVDPRSLYRVASITGVFHFYVACCCH